MEKLLMFIVLAIICYIGQIVGIHLEFKINKKLFFEFYSRTIINIMLYSILNDDSARDEFINSLVGDKNV